MESSEPTPPPRESATAPPKPPKAPPASAATGSAGGAAASTTIIHVPAERRLEAIQALLRSDRSAADRFIQFAADHRIRLDALWGHLDDRGRIAFAALASPSAGRTATLFASAARTGGEVAPLATLIHHVLGSMGPLDVDLAQALVDPGETRQISVYEQSGMDRLASLSYMERPTPRRSAGATPPVVWPADLRVERWECGTGDAGGATAAPEERRTIGTPSSRAELIDALERSYVGTLDCPALAGLRSGNDILDGHLHSGTFEPSLWSLLRFRSGPHAGRVAGVCLFNSSTNAASGSGSLELVYFGLVPEARGRGLGRLLLQHGLDELRDRSETTVMLAVDDRNEPAHRIYRQAGFRTRFRRIAFIRGVRR